jgi:uncharacterized protein
MNLFESCKENDLGVQLKWINEPVNWKFGHDGQLIFTALQDADFFRDPAGEHVRSSAPFLYTTISGDFAAFTRVSVEMIEDYDSGCFMIMDDAKNWAKICYEYIEKVPSIASVVTKNTSDDSIFQKTGTIKPYLRITRSKNCFAFHYSLDAKLWTLVRYFGMDCPPEVKVGVAAQCPVGKECRVTFDFLDYSQKEIKDLRSAE